MQFPFRFSLGVFGWLIFSCLSLAAQSDAGPLTDSSRLEILSDFTRDLADAEYRRLADSVQLNTLLNQLMLLSPSRETERAFVAAEIKAIETNQVEQQSRIRFRLDSMRSLYTGFPVLGIMNDTLFFIYARSGSYSPRDRAQNIAKRIRNLYENDLLVIDSIEVIHSETTYDIIYQERTVMSITRNDALWEKSNMPALAKQHAEQIKADIQKARQEFSLTKKVWRISVALVVILILIILLWLTGWLFTWLNKKLLARKHRWLRNFKYHDYTFFTHEQQEHAFLMLSTVVQWAFYILLLYLSLPVIFSIFPFSRAWAEILFHLIWTPFNGMALAVWHYLPNLFSILIILLVMRYVNRIVRFFFREIDTGKLQIQGFHTDWAMPTYTIVRYLLYAFTFVLIFPYLPGSDSNIFKGVSVFLGVLFSLGSSSAIANIIAGLVITYMRPFKLGDRIRIGEVTGDVIEKTMLVTRIKTVKNETVTIPNSAILSGNTMNYSSEAMDKGLILHSTVTIGYDVPWKDMHQALIDAALRCDEVMKHPLPFVYQTGLEDFYVSYQINAYTREANRQAFVYSQLHQHIQDVCNERGIEILSPHYRYARDGNHTTIPKEYLSPDYKAPGFKITMDKDKGEE